MGEKSTVSNAADRLWGKDWEVTTGFSEIKLLTRVVLVEWWVWEPKWIVQEKMGGFGGSKYRQNFILFCSTKKIVLFKTYFTPILPVSKLFYSSTVSWLTNSATAVPVLP